MKNSKEPEKILYDRFGHDSIVALATCSGNSPSVRYVDTFYENGAFYILTYALSEKMKSIEMNPQVAIAGEWFTAKAVGVNLGYFGKKENHTVADKMIQLFSSWIYNGHSDLQDENTVILKLVLKSGVLISDGTRYEIEF